MRGFGRPKLQRLLSRSQNEDACVTVFAGKTGMDFDAVQKLLAPITDPVDAAAFPYDQGNPKLDRINHGGAFYIRGVKYNLVPRDDESLDYHHMGNGGYLGGRATSCVWKAKRGPGQPLHDVRDPKHKVDRICPILNSEDVCVRIVRCNADECSQARRELQMTARAQHYVPGVMMVVAVTDVPHDATEGPVAIDARWQPGVPDAANRFIVIVGEVAKRGALKWVIKDSPDMLYRSVSKIRAAAARAAAASGATASAGTAVQAHFDPRDEESVRKTAVRLLQHVKTMHLHGIVHRRISINTVIFDDTGNLEGSFGVRLASFDEAMPLQDPTLGATPAAEDVFAVGGVFLSLLRAEATKEAAMITAEQRADPVVLRASFAYGVPSDAALSLLMKMRDPDPARRPSVDECLYNGWLSKENHAQHAMESTMAFVCKQKHFVHQWKKHHTHAAEDGGRSPLSGGGGGSHGGGGGNVRKLTKQTSGAKLAFRDETYDRASRLRAPVTDSISAESFSYEQGNPPLTVLKKDGRFFIRGVEYRMINKSIKEGGYLGGGAFGKVWKAERVSGQPLHDVRDRHDRVSPLLNKQYICAKLFRSGGTATDRLVPSPQDARREIQMQSRANYYLPGVMAVLAITPLAHGATEGPVTIADDAPWALPHVSECDGSEKTVDGSERWVMMACELAERQSLKNWVKRLDAKTQHGIQTDSLIFSRKHVKDPFASARESRTRLGSTPRGANSPTEPRRALSPGGVAVSSPTRLRSPHPRAHRASSMLRMGLNSPTRPEGESREAHGDTVHEKLAKGLIIRLLRLVKEQHAHGIVHLDIKMDNICIDGHWRVRLLDYGESRISSDEKLRSAPDQWSHGTTGFRAPRCPLPGGGTSPVTDKADVWSIGAVLYCLLASSSNVIQMQGGEAWWTHSLFKACGMTPGGIDEDAAGVAYPGGDEHVCDIRDDAKDTVGAFFQQLREYFDQPGFEMLEFLRPHEISPSLLASDLLCKLLRFKDDDRLSAAAALNHPWFDDHNDAEFDALVDQCAHLYGEAMHDTLVEAAAAGDQLDGLVVGSEIDMAGIVKVVVPPITPQGSTASQDDIIEEESEST